MHSVNVISIDATQKLRVCLVRLTPGTETLVCSQIDTSLASPPFTPEGEDGGEGEWNRGRKKKWRKKVEMERHSDIQAPTILEASAHYLMWKMLPVSDHSSDSYKLSMTRDQKLFNVYF